MPAFYKATIDNFLHTSSNEILGCLLNHYSNHQLIDRQTQAWKEQIYLFQNSLKGLSGEILFEYPIPRRGKRIDNILLINGYIFAIECKMGADQYLSSYVEQLSDYCLDLKDFHLESRNVPIVPLLVCSNAKYLEGQELTINDDLFSLQYANESNLNVILNKILTSLPQRGKNINATLWDSSKYEPTPSIIKTAQLLYANKNVKEITRSHAGGKNLTETSKYVLDCIYKAKTNKEKIICFITGVPGAGKTLAGLNIIHSNELNKEHLGAFLSGNMPLVDVLTEALAQDKQIRDGGRIGDARREIQTFIQKAQHFLKEYYDRQELIPPDNVIVFDEAQRAWDKEQTQKSYNSLISQPQMMLEIMDRHSEWAVIIALIGGGQEINTGEAGIAEWGRSLQENFPNWKILVSPKLMTGHHTTAGMPLFQAAPVNLNIEENDSLHLEVSLRSFNAECLSEFIVHVLENELEDAQRVFKQGLNDYPLFYTRSLETAKEWLKNKTEGRSGLIGSSGAKRLKPHGLFVSIDNISPSQWFLAKEDDIRSSSFLEDIATEYSVQGLELDWSCVCWGGDFSYQNSQWNYRRFSGTKWQNVTKTIKKEFIKNKYRVLLSRGREGMIIWIPPGSETDKTRFSQIYDGTANYFKSIGIPEI